MGIPVVASSIEDAPPPKSFLDRFIGVFISPGETFEDIARKPDFIAPLIISTLLAIAGTEIFLAKIGLAPIFRYAMEHSSRPSTPEQIQQTMERVIPIQTVVTHFAGALYVPLICLIDALLALLIVKAIFGAQISFKTAFSIPCYAFLIGIIPSLMGMALVFFGDPEHIITNPSNPTPTTLGFFLNPAETSKPILSLASSFDIFTLWFLALLGIGFSQASGRKVSSLTAFFCFFAAWMVWVLIKLGGSFFQ
jgi:hypothetical protein